jgi:surfeit locus 1 family protein
LQAPPVPAPGPDQWLALDVRAAEYQPVTVTGEFSEPRQEVYVAYTLTDPKGPVGGLGFMVMRPLRTTEGWTVYVNRGFVPSDRRYPNQRPEGEIAGTTTVTGLLRAPYRAPWFVSDGISDNVWFSRDPKLYADAYGAPSSEVAPYIIDAAYDPNLPGGLPQGGETLVQFPNSHLGYAITWFGLAAALAAVFGVYAVRTIRGGRDGGRGAG